MTATMNRGDGTGHRGRVKGQGVAKISSAANGFTLLEVLVAIAILAIALTSLLGLQSQSLSLAIEMKFNVTAAFLAQEKIAEYQTGLIEFTSDRGDFGRDFPGYTWRAEVQNADIFAAEGLVELERPLQRLDLTVGWQEQEYSTVVTLYGSKRQP
ncbi:MAG: prepilin-type N-terminal cleavage/methylation domain-containing protein [Desulfopila sp.]